MAGNRQPLGIELVKRGIVKQDDIAKAIEYQEENPKEKLGDILYKLRLADPDLLLSAIGDILEEKTIMLTLDKIKVKVSNYISFDVAKEDLAVPFDIENGVIKVCFANTSNKSQVEAVRLLMLNKGLVMEKYLTFKEKILNVLSKLSDISTDSINTDANRNRYNRQYYKNWYEAESK